MTIWVNTPTGKVGCWNMAMVEELLYQGNTISHYQWEDAKGMHIATCKENPYPYPKEKKDESVK